jgi:two-component system chemotaxis sensor kinase CheA
VGLDVVREKVEQLHGLINFESSLGVGSRFTLTLPLTLSTSHVCLIKCEEETFAIPISSIDRILLVDYEDISSIESKMAIEADGHPLSLVDTAQILELATGRRKLTPGKKFWAVILGSAERRMAFLVDELIGESRVVVKSLGKELTRVRNTSGATISSTGKVIMMLNVSDMIRSACSQDVTSRLGKVAASVEEGGKSVQVGDDSSTTRILEKNILETAGYDVILASDGQEAWEMLEENECSLIVSDICMPRMNGFEFTAKVKRSEKHRETPVILVTSLESREDKERGIEVGADAYIVKSSFDQANLLETIKRLI